MKILLGVFMMMISMNGTLYAGTCDSQIGALRRAANTHWQDMPQRYRTNLEACLTASFNQLYTRTFRSEWNRRCHDHRYCGYPEKLRDSVVQQSLVMLRPRIQSLIDIAVGYAQYSQPILSEHPRVSRSEVTGAVSQLQRAIREASATVTSVAVDSSVKECELVVEKQGHFAGEEVCLDERETEDLTQEFIRQLNEIVEEYNRRMQEIDSR